MRRTPGPILILGGLLALTYVAGAALYLFWATQNDELAGDPSYHLDTLSFVGGFALLVAGFLLARRPTQRVAALLISVGALLGAIPLYWSLLIPFLAILLVVFAVGWARRPPKAA